MRVVAAIAAAALVPAAAGAQVVSIGAAREPGGSIAGRVCVDRDGDGRCGEREPGVTGARILGEGGEVATAGADGRFHLFEVAGRFVARDRSAYGGHAVVVEGLGVRRAFELGPGGAAEIDLAVRPPGGIPPQLAPSPGEAPPPERGPDGAMRFGLGARTVPGAAVAVAGTETNAGPEGTFGVTVPLSPGENRLALAVVGPDGGGGIWVWPVHLVRRARGGDLVIPRWPERIASLSVSRGAGGGALVVGEAGPLRVRVGEIAVAPGASFAAYVARGSRRTIEITEAGGRAVVRADIPLPPHPGPLPPLVRGERKEDLGAGAGSRVSALAALGEVEVAMLGGKRTLVTARGAAAARGRVGPFEYEAGVDVDDRDRHLEDLGRPRDALAAEHALDPARTFVASGDAGAAGDRNPGRGRLWGRVEGEGLRLDLGNARTGLTGSELGRYDRAIFGAKALAVRDVGPLRLEATAFGATLRADEGGNAPPRAAHDVLAATGGAAFWLANRDVVPGSEAIRIEWRDPFTGRISGQRTLVRGEGYEIDWVVGRLTLAVPLSSVRPPETVLTGDPFAAQEASVVADYLFAAAGAAGEDLQGGRVGAALGPVAVSAHGAREDRPGGEYRLVSGAAAISLGPWLVARAEVARSSGALFEGARGDAFVHSSDGGIGFAAAGADGGSRADALHINADGEVGPIAYAGWWRERGAGYSDAEFHEPIAARERGAEISAERGSYLASVLLAERRGADPRDPAGLTLLDGRRLVVRGGWHGERAGLVGEVVDVSRDALDSAEETSAGARASYELDPSLTVDVSHHQGVRVAGAGRDPTFTAAGATLVRGGAALSVRGGWGPEIGPRLLVSGERRRQGEAVYGTFTADPDAPSLLGERASALGARRRDGAAEIFTEEQFARDAFGLRQARVIGASLELARGLHLSLTAERGTRLRLDGSEASRRGAAGALGIVAGPLRVAARGEARSEGDDAQVAAGGSAEWMVAPGVHVGARTTWMHGTSEGREALAFEAAIGGALRRDRMSLLGSVSRLAERRPGAARRDGVLGRLAATADAWRRLELGLGAGIALQRVEGGSDDRISGSARARVRIHGPFDAAIEYARRAPLRGGDLGALDSLRAEAGVAARDCRFALGYNFIGFGGDGLSPAADTNRLYVRAQLAY